MIRILVNGAAGRMGQLTVRTLSTHSDMQVVAQTGRTDNLANVIQNHQPDVVVDFTQADSALTNLDTILENNARPVMGTSGLTHSMVRQAAERFPGQGGVIAPNFSVAAVLAMKYAGEMARHFPDVEIIEMHHAGKLDSPSGTALRTAEILSASRKKTHPEHSGKTHETIAGARGATHEGIAIHAIRLPGVLAQLQIVFGSQGETLTLRHDTIDRKCFMKGIVLACQKVMALNQLVHGLEHIL